jgi:tRNA(Ile)-lysidine synthase
MTGIAQRCGADRIAVGHTVDDQAETVLLWMLRGAGLAGLSGMPVSRDGVIIRPLYEVSRKELLAYLQQEGLLFRRDSSNDKPIYLRNRVRQEIVPALQRVVPSATNVLCRLADTCREDDRYIEEQVAALCNPRISRLPDGGQAIDRSFLQEVPRAVQRRVVRALLRQCSLQNQPPSIRRVERVLHAVAKRDGVSDIVFPTARVTVGRDVVRFFPLRARSQSHDRSHEAVPTVLPVPGQVTWAATGQCIQVQRSARKDIHAMPYAKDRIVVDADRVSEPLVVRAWQPGDRFCPSGMNGRSKKLQDFFTDLKVFGGDRRQIPVVTGPEGIVWIVGYRRDDRWSVTATTERCLVMTVGGPSVLRGN